MERLGYLDKHNLPVIKLLEDSDWSNDFIQIQLEILAPYFQSLLAPAGTIIIQEDELTNYFCIICEGSVDIVKKNKSGNLKTLKTLGQNKIIGEMAFFDRFPSAASVIAKEPTLLLIMNESSFNLLCDHFPHIALKIVMRFMKTISLKLRETNGKLIDLL